MATTKNRNDGDSFVPERPKDASAWGARKTHSVVLPSGAEVTIQIPSLPMLARTGQIPNDLIENAVLAMQGEAEITAELLVEQADFYDKLIALTVVEPKITEEQVAGLPYEDVEMLAELATRQRDVDALGRHIAGLHKSKEFRTFRTVGYRDAAVEGV